MSRVIGVSAKAAGIAHRVLRGEALNRRQELDFARLARCLGNGVPQTAKTNAPISAVEEGNFACSEATAAMLLVDSGILDLQRQLATEFELAAERRICSALAELEACSALRIPERKPVSEADMLRELGKCPPRSHLRRQKDERR